MIPGPVADRFRQFGFAGPTAERVRQLVIIASALVVGLGVMLELSKKAPGGLGVVAAAGGIAAAMAVIGLRDPRWAFVFMMVATFLRPAIPKILPTTDPFVLAFGGLIISALAWMRGRPERRVRIGAIECAMLLYVLWNLNSILQAHEYQPILYPLTGEMLDLRRYLIIGTVMPFATYLIARMIFSTRAAVGFLVGTLLGCSAYSAWVSIMQFYGPKSLIWPKYIAYAPAWAERACGLPNQPEVNGLILIVGYVLSLVLMSSEKRPRWQKIGLAVIAAACAVSVYLTHTRSIWLDFAVVVLLAIVLGKGFRTGFVVTALAATTIIAMNWSTFTSADRKAGGVASTNEVYDRLNADTTAVWAWTQKPFSGWGLGRFVMVNTYRHQQYSPFTPWERGLGIPAHETELGILAELGIVGLLLWLTVLILLSRRLLLAYLRLPAEGLMGRPLAFTAATAFVSLLLGGVFVDLRLFDYPSTMVFALVGATVGAADRLPRPPKVNPLEAGRAHRAELRAANSSA
ncbi:O-antigen ligase family protein [Nocardia sp. CDC153]|uniref:O-antigen ligase family protein n=1 Tax=Nocardia sp. CDC153 TaxID=3112167 RepID=UPI002DBD580E|nr:O-antigen ligase family protein [Nocardia sp. CDC153]MEC3955849.1 O-antigen ligase family protein [Nocardia sp. CDC153]